MSGVINIRLQSSSEVRPFRVRDNKVSAELINKVFGIYDGYLQDESGCAVPYDDVDPNTTYVIIPTGPAVTEVVDEDTRSQVLARNKMMEMSPVSRFLAQHWTILKRGSKVKKVEPIVSLMHEANILTWEDVLATPPEKWDQLGVPAGVRIKIVEFAQFKVGTQPSEDLGGLGTGIINLSTRGVDTVLAKTDLKAGDVMFKMEESVVTKMQYMQFASGSHDLKMSAHVAVYIGGKKSLIAEATRDRGGGVTTVNIDVKGTHTWKIFRLKDAAFSNTGRIKADCAAQIAYHWAQTGMPYHTMLCGSVFWANNTYNVSKSKSSAKTQHLHFVSKVPAIAKTSSANYDDIEQARTQEGTYDKFEKKCAAATWAKVYDKGFICSQYAVAVYQALSADRPIIALDAQNSMPYTIAKKLRDNSAEWEEVGNVAAGPDTSIQIPELSDDKVLSMFQANDLSDVVDDFFGRGSGCSCKVGVVAGEEGKTSLLFLNDKNYNCTAIAGAHHNAIEQGSNCVGIQIFESISFVECETKEVLTVDNMDGYDFTHAAFLVVFFKGTTPFVACLIDIRTHKANWARSKVANWIVNGAGPKPKTKLNAHYVKGLKLMWETESAFLS